MYTYHTFIYVYLYTHITEYVCTYTCMYIHTYVHRHAHTSSLYHSLKKLLLEVLEDPESVNEFNKAHNSLIISDRKEIKNKDDLWRFLVEILPAIERVKSGNYKLILDRFIAGHELAIKLYELLEKIYGKDKLKEVSEKNK